MLFTDLPLTDSLLEGLEAMNFKETTPVQEQAIPVILEKKDVIACAQTGTGKTAAFLLPLLNNLQNDHHDEGKVNAIIMAPTRELAQQIDQMMEGFSYYTPFSSVAVYGGNDGEAWDVQKRGLQSGADVVISTPGRLLSHINLYNIDFSGVKYFILDEADRMLDMGFHEDIMKIEKLLPKDRQTVMFSATMPPKIQQLAKTIQRDPVEISIAIARPPETILQSAYICYEAQKIGIVKDLFKDKKPNKVILFSGSKMKVKEIAKTLHRMKLSVGEMHSDLDQSQRDHVMHEFRNERVDILVATDIVARGIDIDDISLVINFDVPYDVEDYVHRIGRTARAGDSGMAITFVSPDEQYRFSLIEKFLQKEIYRIPIPAELGDAPEYNPVRDMRRRGASVRSQGSGKKGRGKEQKSRSSDNRSSERAERTEKREWTKKSERAERGDRERDNKLERQDRSQKTEKQSRAEKSQKQDRSQKTEKQGKAEKSQESLKAEGSKRSEEANRTGQQERSERSKKYAKPKQARKEGETHSERSPRKNEQSHSEGNRSEKRDQRREQGSRQKPKSRQGQEIASKQENTGGQRASEKQHASTAERKQRLHQQKSGKERHEYDEGATKKKVAKKRPSNDKYTPKPQAGSGTKQEEAATKTKKWSWWPFGKKEKG